MRLVAARPPPREPGTNTVVGPGWRGARSLPRPYWTLVAGQVIGQLGDGLSQIAFAQLVVFDIGRGATPGSIAGILSATLLPFSAVGPLAGVLIDRWDRRRTLVVASVTRAVLAAVAVAAAVSRSEALAYVGVVLLLSSSRFVLDTKGAVLPRTVPAVALVRANALSTLAGTGAAFVGAVGGATFVSWSASAGFVTGAVSYLAAGAVFGRLPPVGGAAAATGGLGVALRGLAGELRAGGAAIVRTPQLRRPLTAVALHRLLLGGGFVLLVLVADRRYHLQTSGYGLAIAVTGVAAVLGAVSAPWLAGRWPPPALLPLGFLPPAGAVVAVGYGPTLPGLVAAVAVAAVAFQALKVLCDALIGGAALDAVRGRVFAIYDVVYNVAFVVAGLLMIPLWRLGRERALLWWLGAAFTVGWLVLARLVGGWPFGRRARAADNAPQRWWWRSASVAAGALLLVTFPRPALWWAAWFGLVPWLLLLRRAPTVREAAVRGFCAAVGFLLAVHYWLLPSTTVFLPVAAALLAALWVPWSALVWRLLAGPPTAGRVAVAVVVVPAGWVLIEAVRSWSALGGPWGLLGATQWASPRFLASASLGGVWLVSWLVVAVNVALVALVEGRSWRSRAAAGSLAAVLLAVGPVWYAAQAPPRDGQLLRVAVVETGVVASPAQRLAGEIAASAALPADRYDLVVWGESSVGDDVFTDPALRERLQSLAGRLGSDLLVGVDARSPTGAIRKTAVLLDRGGIRASYEKIRLVPFGEYVPVRPLLGWLDAITKAAAVDRVHGDRVVVMSAGTVPFVTLICFESAFPDLSRTAARAGAWLLVLQTATTTFQGSWAQNQQASLAAVRAVETGRPAVQAGLAGTTGAFDADGHRLLWHPAATGTAAVDLRVALRTTPFDRWGDWWLACCVVVIVLALLGISLAAAGPAIVR